jgi:hypothetical protein
MRGDWSGAEDPKPALIGPTELGRAFSAQDASVCLHLPSLSQIVRE